MKVSFFAFGIEDLTIKKHVHFHHAIAKPQLRLWPSEMNCKYLRWSIFRGTQRHLVPLSPWIWLGTSLTALPESAHLPEDVSPKPDNIPLCWWKHGDLCHGFSVNHIFFPHSDLIHVLCTSVPSCFYVSTSGCWPDQDRNEFSVPLRKTVQGKLCVVGRFPYPHGKDVCGFPKRQGWCPRSLSCSSLGPLQMESGSLLVGGTKWAACPP